MAEEAGRGEVEDLAGECTDFFLWMRGGGGARWVWAARSRLGFFLLRETVLRSYSALLFGLRPKK
jgi:hypothetical protein